MSNATNSGSTNSGFFGSIMNTLTGKKNSGLNTRKNNTNSKNSNIATPVTAGTNVNTSKVSNQTGGMAPTNFRYPPNMQQPSERVMQWATTAGAPMPPESEMRGVAHGGRRRSIRKRRSHRRKTRGGTHRPGHRGSHHRRHRKSKSHRRTHRRRN
jgi:hypothetical protein